MPLAALLLVLGAALCHSAWNLLVKTDARRLEIQSGALIVGVLLCSPVLLIYSLADVSRLAWGVIFVSGLFETAYVLDRKSTRLNSSHLVISYAVFCLKKK